MDGDNSRMKNPNRTRLYLVCAAIVVSACGNAPLQSPQAQCRAARAQEFLGQVLDDRVIAEARAAAGGMRTRVIKADSAATAGAGADPLRLNIEVDDQNRISRMVCG